MADNADDVQAEITLDDFMADEQKPAKAESSPAKEAKEEAKAEPKAEEKTEVVEKPEDKEKTPDPEEEPADPDKAEEPEEDAEKPQGEQDKPLKPKSENRFQSLANENKELRRQVEQLVAQVYQPATEEELANEVNPETGENYNRLEAKFEAYRQQQEVEKYNSTVVEAQSAISQEAFSVLNDFPVFNPDNKEAYDEELASEAAQLLDASLIRSPDIPELDDKGQPTGRGIVIGSSVSPYQLYKTLARASSISATKGQVKGQEATEKQLANADSSNSTAPPVKKVDPLLALWQSDD